MNPQFPLLLPSFSSSFFHLLISSLAETYHIGLEVIAYYEFNSKTLADELPTVLDNLHLRIVPFRLKFVLDNMSPRLISEVIKSGWSWVDEIPLRHSTNYKWTTVYSWFFILTGCRFLFSRWFCSIIFKSCSPSSNLSVKKNVPLNMEIILHKYFINTNLVLQKSLTGRLHVLGGEARKNFERDSGHWRRRWLWCCSP